MRLCYSRKTLKASYKCRPSSLRTKISCEGESLSISCAPPLRIAISSSVFTRSPTSLVYCPKEHPQYKEQSCKPLVITSQVSSMCHGYHKCSLQADPVVFSMFSGGALSEESVVCHKNYSALRTTSACVDEKIFSPLFLNKFSTSTERPSTIIQAFIPPVTTETLHNLTTSNLSFNISKSLEEIQAKPLEPKPAIIKVLKNDVKHGSDLITQVIQIKKQ